MRKKLYILSALLLLATPFIAPAQPSAPSALEGWSIPAEGTGGQAGSNPAASPARPLTGHDLMELGEESFGVGDYDRALDNFKNALPLLTFAADKAKAHERLAYIYAAFGQTDKVYNELVEALKLDPGLSMDPNLVSPKIYEAYKKARDLVVREGTLTCNCDPSGAEVYLNGAAIGEAPVKKEHIPEGEYTLTLKKPGYETSTDKVTIKKDVTLTVEDKLVEARGEVSISSDPAGAVVTFDGHEQGVTPVTVKRVSGGSHSLVMKLDYHDDYESSVSIEKAEKKSVAVTMKRRLLLVGMVDGEQDGEGLSPVLAGLISGPFSKVEGLRLIPKGLRYLEKGLVERGLDPAALKFLKQQKTRLDLEDSSVFSGIMEKEGAEIAMVVRLRQDGKEKALTLTLYSIASDMGDRVVIKSGDMDGLTKEVEGFLRKWEDQELSKGTTIGVRVVDRAAGGVEVIDVLPGFPAAAAGLVPGDLINAAGSTEVKEKKDLVPLLKPGKKLEIKFIGHGSRRSASIVPALAPLEAPVDSPDYLYNLALVNYATLAAGADQPGTAKRPEGYTALNLGNVYFRLGEFGKAVETYQDADTGTNAGVCTGTALYRQGRAYEQLDRWVDAAGSYRKAMMLYPEATIESAEGPYVAPLAKERLEELYRLRLVKERWWL